MDPGIMNNMELLQTLAALNWSESGNSEMFQKVATFRVG